MEENVSGCFFSEHSVHGRRFLQVKRPNQKYQSTEGKSYKGKTENTNNKIHIYKHNSTH